MVKLKTKKKKGIVFCFTCNRIVGDSFPVDHKHDYPIGVATYLIRKKRIGMKLFEDTPENRNRLAINHPPGRPI